MTTRSSSKFSHHKKTEAPLAQQDKKRNQSQHQKESLALQKADNERVASQVDKDYAEDEAIQEEFQNFESEPYSENNEYEQKYGYGHRKRGFNPHQKADRSGSEAFQVKNYNEDDGAEENDSYSNRPADDTKDDDQRNDYID